MPFAVRNSSRSAIVPPVTSTPSFRMRLAWMSSTIVPLPAPARCNPRSAYSMRMYRSTPLSSASLHPPHGRVPTGFTLSRQPTVSLRGEMGLVGVPLLMRAVPAKMSPPPAPRKPAGRGAGHLDRLEQRTVGFDASVARDEDVAPKARLDAGARVWARTETRWNTDFTSEHATHS